MKREEEFIRTRGGLVWYEFVGDKKKTPLIIIHGGPGYPHDSLKPLEDLADEIPVIFYDQLGCGNSQKVDDKSFWTAKYFVEELETLIKKLKLKNYHILGHSWGAALGALLALKQPKGLKSLILADPYLSTPIWEKDAKRLLSKFSSEKQKILKNPKSKKYGEVSNEFYYKHVYRMRSRPTAALKASFKMNYELYNYMWGPEEFKPTGTLKNFDLSNRLHKIKVSTLLYAGRYDEATPEAIEYFANLMPNVKTKVFEKSAHKPQFVERKEVIKTIKSFLKNLQLA
jgi:proline iminopeptidase